MADPGSRAGINENVLVNKHGQAGQELRLYRFRDERSRPHERLDFRAHRRRERSATLDLDGPDAGPYPGQSFGMAENRGEFAPVTVPYEN
jgi:hypothetical protein